MSYCTKKVSAVFVFEQDGCYLFQKRNKGFGAGRYLFPGGHVDAGETVLTAAVREIREELGVTVYPNDLKICLVEEMDTHIVFFFKVLRYQGELKNCEPEKHADMAFLTPDNLLIHPVCIKEIHAIQNKIPALFLD